MQQNSAERRRITRNVLLALLTILLLAAVLYIAVQLYAILHRTYRTETAIKATMSDSVLLNGAAVFSATAVQGSGNLGYLVNDGERVTVGTTLAEYYTQEGQDLLREEMTNLDREISLLERSQNSSGSDLSLLTTQTRSALYNLLDQLDAGNYSGILDAQEEFLLAQNRMQVSTGQSQGVCRYHLPAAEPAGCHLRPAGKSGNHHGTPERIFYLGGVCGADHTGPGHRRRGNSCPAAADAGRGPDPFPRRGGGLDCLRLHLAVLCGL